MDQELLVEPRIDEGRDFLLQLHRDGLPVKAAFWVHTLDPDRWHLYIAVDVQGGQSLSKAYSDVIGSLYKLPNRQLSMLDINVVSTSDPIAQAVLRVRQRATNRLPIRYKGEQLGELEIEEAYVYPAAGPLTPPQVIQTVADHMNRGGPVAPSLIELADGTSLTAVISGMHLNPTGAHVLVRDMHSPQEREIPAIDIVSIR